MNMKYFIFQIVKSASVCLLYYDDCAVCIMKSFSQCSFVLSSTWQARRHTQRALSFESPLLTHLLQLTIDMKSERNLSLVQQCLRWGYSFYCAIIFACFYTIRRNLSRWLAMSLMTLFSVDNTKSSVKLRKKTKEHEEGLDPFLFLLIGGGTKYESSNPRWILMSFQHISMGEK